jgi:hypothetical protein
MEKMIEEFAVAKPRLQARKHECNILHPTSSETKNKKNKARTLREDRKAMMRGEERRTGGAVEDAGEYE